MARPERSRLPKVTKQGGWPKNVMERSIGLKPKINDPFHVIHIVCEMSYEKIVKECEGDGKILPPTIERCFVFSAPRFLE